MKPDHHPDLDTRLDDGPTPIGRQLSGWTRAGVRANESGPYITREGEGFVRRKFPKVKGKATVKAAKRARMAARNRA